MGGAAPRQDLSQALYRTSAGRLIHAPGLLQCPPPSTTVASARLGTQEYSPGILPNTSDYPARGVIAGGGGVAQTPCQCADTLPAPPPGFQGQVRVLVSCPNRRSLWRGGRARERGRSPSQRHKISCKAAPCQPDELLSAVAPAHAMRPGAWATQGTHT